MTSPRIRRLNITNYRSVGSEPVKLAFPTEGPLVLLGENNAGKSNITRAIDLIFGERWPSNYSPEDHEFHERDRENTTIKIGASVVGIRCRCGQDLDYIRWEFDNRNTPACNYSYSCSTCSMTYMSRDIRDQLLCMFIGADRNLSYQLSYASKYTLLSKLMHRFHETLVSDEDRSAKLKQIFDSTVEQFEGVPDFAKFRSTLRAMTTELGQGLTHLLDIDFSAYDPSNFFRALRVHARFEGEIRSFDELGTGQAQILTLAFAYSYARAFGQRTGLVLVVDEPEAHLHPLAQQWLARKLSALTTDGLQVVVTTHSPHFVNLAQPDNLVFVRRNAIDSPTRTRQLTREELADSLRAKGAHATRTTATSTGGFYAANATTEIVNGVFAKACVLVEGLSEALAIPELLRLVGVEPSQSGIAFINVQGIKNIAKWHRFFDSFDIPCYPIFDTDSDKSGDGMQSALDARIDIMKALGRDQDQASNFPLDALTVRKEYACLDPQFEGAMTKFIGQRWDELYSAAAATVGDSKALRARYAAQGLKLEDLPETAARRLRELASCLADLVTAVSTA